MKKYPIGIGIVILVLIGMLWILDTRIANAPSGGQACTQEAKLCPDGSAVGRTGPKCEFTECPSTGDTTSPLEARIDQEVSSGGVRITPLEILEESRCPSDVTCIQAGTVRIRARLISGLGEAMQEFKIGQSITTEAESVTLTEVSPYPKAGIKIKEADYLFQFEIKKRETIAPPSGSGVHGVVSLGPTCPVERMPPDPLCADKPYATAIVVYRTGSKLPFVIGNSNANGAFTFSLPPGAYTLATGDGKMLPRCAETSVNVLLNAYATANISCDTGIR